MSTMVAALSAFLSLLRPLNPGGRDLHGGLPSPGGLAPGVDEVSEDQGL